MNAMLGLHPPSVKLSKEQQSDTFHSQTNSYVCYVCLSAMDVAIRETSEGAFCSDVCFLAHKNAQSVMDMRMAENMAQTQRYTQLAEQARQHAATMLLEPVNELVAYAVDIDLDDNIEVHYGSELLTNYKH